MYQSDAKCLADFGKGAYSRLIPFTFIYYIPITNYIIMF